MISKIIKVEVGVISRSRRLRLITLTKTLIILDITKPNLITIFFELFLGSICHFEQLFREKIVADAPLEYQCTL